MGVPRFPVSIAGLVLLSKQRRNALAKKKNRRSDPSTYKSYWDDKCLVLFRLIVRERAGQRCEYTDPFTGERCMQTADLEPHHYYGRDFWPLRHDWRNGVALCHWHHRVAEQFPAIFEEFMRGQRAADLPYLREIFATNQDRSGAYYGIPYYRDLYLNLVKKAERMGIVVPGIAPAVRRDLEAYRDRQKKRPAAPGVR
jgi:hypothetical protein